MSLKDQMEAAATNNLTDDDFKEVSILVEEYLKLEEKIAGFQSELKTCNDRVEKISKELIPELLSGYQLKILPLRNGQTLHIKPFIYASVTEQNRAAAFKWLRDNGFGDIIKRNIAVAFGQGEEAQAAKLYEDLVGQGVNVTDKEAIHASTLKSFVKEQIEGGNLEFPKELFSVHEGQEAIIK